MRFAENGLGNGAEVARRGPAMAEKRKKLCERAHLEGRDYVAMSSSCS